MADLDVLERSKKYIFCVRNYERADLRGKDLRGVNFTGSNFRGADLSGCDLRGASFVACDLSRAVLANVNAEGADFSAADMTNAYLRGARFVNCQMWHVCLKGVIAKNTDFAGADLTGGDVARAELLGARFEGAITTRLRNVDRAIVRWFMNPLGGKPCYDPFPGAIVLESSITGATSFQENAGMGQTGLGYR